MPTVVNSPMFVVALLCIACAAYWWWRRRSATTAEPPYVAGAWPIVGHAPLLYGDACNLWNQLNNAVNQSYDFGGVLAARIGPRTVYPTHGSLCLQLVQYQEPYIETPVYMDLDVITIVLLIECPDTKKSSDHIQVCDQDTTHDSISCLQLGQCQEPDIETPVMDLNVITTVIADPDDCHTVATTCMEKEHFYDFLKPWVGDGLITAKYSIWKDHRKFLNPAFSQIVLDTFMDIFNSQSRKLVKELDKEAGTGLFDHWKYTRQNALETICLTALGIDSTDSNLKSKYLEATDQIFYTIVERGTKLWWHSPYTFAWSKLKKEQDSHLKIVHNMSNTVLQKRKSQLKRKLSAEKSVTEGTKLKPFIDLLLEQEVFNDKEIRDHVDTMIAAGHDTSSNVLMFTMVLLGSHPEAQEKVFAEIQEILGGKRDLEKTDLSRLLYLEAVLKESMRVFTIVPIIARYLDRDVKLKKYTLSAGRSCFFFLFGLHKHPMWSPDRYEFKPERWLEPGRMPDNPNAFAAFGLGRRQCIGKAYAMMSMKTTIAHVVRSYRIHADHTKIRLKYFAVLKPDNEGFFISIERRT